jgi:hypothetical protein
MIRSKILSALAGTFVLAACAATPPTGPTVVTVPPEGKNLSQFQQEDASCRQYAANQIGYPTPTQAGVQSSTGSTAASTHNTNVSTRQLQLQYDTAYIQCMAASGNRLQGFTGAYSSYYPYNVAYADPAYYDPWYDPWFGPLVGFGFVGGFGHRFHHGGFHHDGFAHGGFAHGGFHGR